MERTGFEMRKGVGRWPGPQRFRTHRLGGGQRPVCAHVATPQPTGTNDPESARERDTGETGGRVGSLVAIPWSSPAGS